VRVTIHFVAWCLGIVPPETQTSEAERECLTRHASGRKRLVEIGVWHGVTTARLRAAMAADAVLFAIDPFPQGRFGFSMQRIIAKREVGRIPNGTVRWVRLAGDAAGRRFSASGEPPIDFLFIDGDHSYEGLRADWEAWSPLIAAGGVVALHDSRSSQSRSIQEAGSALFTRERIIADPRFSLIDVVDTLSLLRRIP